MTVFKKTSHQVIVLTAVALFFFLPGLLVDRDFWVEDEARYAEVVREMIEENRWLVPHLGGRIYPDKPPLYFWSAAALTPITGEIAPLSFLLVTWLSALGNILGLYFFGRYLFDAPCGFFGALVLTASLLFLGSAQIVRMDMLFSLFILLSLFSFYYGYRAKKSRFYLLFYLFSALAVLTKGPLGFVFVFVPVLLFLLLKPGGGGIKKLVFHPGVCLFVLPVLGWLLSALAAGHGALIEDIFSRQILARATGSFKHREPFYYFFLALPLVFSPWFPFLARAFGAARRGWNREVFLFLSLWFGAGFSVLSLLSGKLFIYLLPLLPPLALCTGHFFGQMWSGEAVPGKIFVLEGSIASLLSLGVFSSLYFAARFFPMGRIEGLSVPSLIFFCLFLASLFAVFRKKFRGLGVLLFVGMGLFSLTVSLFIVPRVEKFYSPRPLGHQVRYWRERGCPPVGYRVTRGILDFYAGGKIEELDEEGLAHFFDSPSPRILVIKNRHWEKQSRESRAQTHILYRRILNNEEYLLVARRGKTPG